MMITRWSPFQAIDREIALLNRALGNSTSAPESVYQPPIEVQEDEASYTLKVALPGVRREEIDVQVTPDVVSLTAEHPYTQDEQKVTHRSELWYGKFTRQFTLARKVNPEQVTAQYENGILELTLPKVMKAQAVKVNLVMDAPKVELTDAQQEKSAQ
ncbi:MAG: Hsp20/alpha crystallin family protein [Gloeobacterales cyanobacterium]